MFGGGEDVCPKKVISMKDSIEEAKLLGRIPDIIFILNHKLRDPLHLRFKKKMFPGSEFVWN